jgi:hypothetical protein
VKRKVLYKINKSNYIKEGDTATVFTLNHPNCTNTRTIRTSVVEKYNRITGVFETKNTVYEPQWEGVEKWS